VELTCSSNQTPNRFVLLANAFQLKFKTRQKWLFLLKAKFAAK